MNVIGLFLFYLIINTSSEEIKSTIMIDGKEHIIQCNCITGNKSELLLLPNSEIKNTKVTSCSPKDIKIRSIGKKSSNNSEIISHIYSSYPNIELFHKYSPSIISHTCTDSRNLKDGVKVYGGELALFIAVLIEFDKITPLKKEEITNLLIEYNNKHALIYCTDIDAINELRTEIPGFSKNSFKVLTDDSTERLVNLLSHSEKFHGDMFFKALLQPKIRYTYRDDFLKNFFSAFLNFLKIINDSNIEVFDTKIELKNLIQIYFNQTDSCFDYVLNINENDIHNIDLKPEIINIYSGRERLKKITNWILLKMDKEINQILLKKNIDYEYNYILDTISQNKISFEFIVHH